MKKRLSSLALALVLILSCAPNALAAAGLHNFQKTNTFTPGQFTDVLETNWFYPNVQSAFEYGLMNGDSATTFSPNANITIAQTLTIAARLHTIYYGRDTQFPPSSPWYQCYVDYCVENGIINENAYEQYTVPATRAQFATILGASVPDEALQPINSIISIPDVPQDAPYAATLLKLYNAGILTGNDDYGYFAPDTPIVRSQVAAIITRIADPDLRIEKTLLVAATSVTLNKTSLTLVAGNSEQLIATLTPSHSTETVEWKSSNPSVATVSENGVVTAVQKGSATIIVTAGPVKATCQVSVESKPIEFSGNGDDVITGINLPRGAYYVEYTCDKGYFGADLYFRNDYSKSNMVANDVGPCSGRMLIKGALTESITNGMLEVTSRGSWTIKIREIIGTTSTNLSGSGDWVCGFFTAKQTRYVCSYTNQGDSNFIVDVYDVETGRSRLAANDIGPCSGKKTVELTPGKVYLLFIRAKGAWTFDMGIGDPLEATTPPNPTPDPGTNPDPGTTPDPNPGESDSNKYTFSEAKEMFDYADNAAKNCTNSLNAVTKSYNNSIPERMLQLSYAKHYADQAYTYLSYVRRIINQNVDLDLVNSSFSTLGELVDDTMNKLDQIRKLTVSEATLDADRDNFIALLTPAGSQCIAIMNLCCQLMEQFVS